jgi:hypothetical protein
MVSQDKPRVDLLRRTHGGWEAKQIAGADALLPVDAVALTLAMPQPYT